MYVFRKVPGSLHGLGRRHSRCCPCALPGRGHRAHQEHQGAHRRVPLRGAAGPPEQQGFQKQGPGARRRSSPARGSLARGEQLRVFRLHGLRRRQRPGWLTASRPSNKSSPTHAQHSIWPLPRLLGAHGFCIRRLSDVGISPPETWDTRAAELRDTPFPARGRGCLTPLRACARESNCGFCRSV